MIIIVSWLKITFIIGVNRLKTLFGINQDSDRYDRLKDFIENQHRSKFGNDFDTLSTIQDFIEVIENRKGKNNDQTNVSKKI